MRWKLVYGLLLLGGCHGALSARPDGSNHGDASVSPSTPPPGPSTTDAAPGVAVVADAGVRVGVLSVPDSSVPAVVLAAPTGYADVPSFSDAVTYTGGQGNVTLYLPAVAGAGDYRAFVLGDGVKASVKPDGSELVEGATIACAGLEQHNQCDDSEATTSFGPNFLVPKCSADWRGVDVGKTLLRRLQLTGLSGKTKVMIEAIDALCPFPGAYGAQHAEIVCDNDHAPVKQAIVGGKTAQWATCPAKFPVRTESEIRADYGSLIINGQAPVPLVAGRSPWESIALPAPNRTPRVLARAVVELDAGDPAAPPAPFKSSDFFESFSDPADQPRLIANARVVTPGMLVQSPTLFQTSKLSLYSYAADSPQLFVAQGVLRSVMADGGQGIMASSVLYPRRAFALPSDDDHYLHASFEVPLDATLRRYWWFHVCGAPSAGKTIVDGQLAPESGIVASPGFMNPLEGNSISPKGWNCIQAVPRTGSYQVVPGGPYKHPTFGDARAESDVRIVLNRPVPTAKGVDLLKDTIMNISPPQEPSSLADVDGAWLRQWNDKQQIVGVFLDDKLFVEQRVKIDFYLNRGRVVMYADGVQKLCNDFPNARLTMAEAAVGLGHVLYHSSAERGELMREDWLRTGQNHYLHNTPFLDQRNFDNFGVREGASLPPGFEPGQCYKASSK